MKRLAPIAAMAVALAACSGGDAGRTWWDGLETDVAPADGFAVPLDDDLTLRFGERRPCVQLEAGDLRTPCNGADLLATYAIGDRRVVWSAWSGVAGSDDLAEVAVDHAVAWSNRSPNGSRVEVYVSGDLQQLAWVLVDGEEPWGLQLLDADGRLVKAWDLVGLPAA